MKCVFIFFFFIDDIKIKNIRNTIIQYIKTFTNYVVCFLLVEKNDTLYYFQFN